MVAAGAPRQLKEAAELLATLPNAKILAGGQSLVPTFFTFIAPHSRVRARQRKGRKHLQKWPVFAVTDPTIEAW
jgi:CO/xanthine dehydrogenase FAD-binding subunit